MEHTPALIESLRDNGGTRSVTRATLPPGAKALRHYHSDFQETFLIQAGHLTIFHNGKNQILGDKVKSYTVPFGEIHTYYNRSTEDVVVDFILEPGHAGCEMTNDIFTGLVADNRVSELTSWGGYNLLWTVLYELTNTIPTGIPGNIYSFLRLFYGKRKMAKVKEELIVRYCKHYYL
jgi:mannose-6-phosphate isomerase-like protein (cupin superfamily)